MEYGFLMIPTSMMSVEHSAEPNIFKCLKMYGSAKCSTVIAENIFEVKFAVDLVVLQFISACFIYP